MSICQAIGPYDGALRAIIHALKYDQRRSVARPLAARMVRECASALEAMDIAVPVPLHPRRQRERGFNQAEEIAAHLGLPCSTILGRNRATASQIGLPAARRHANVRGAFSLRRGAVISGLRVVLVDDVCTTGATLEACAAVLIQAGAVEVRAVTAARVVSTPRE
jgi:ComF family protein